MASAPGLQLSEDDLMPGGTPRRNYAEGYSGGRAQSSTREQMQTPRPEESGRRNSFGGVTTPREADDNDNERNRFDHPMPVFGNGSSRTRAARGVFRGAPSQTQYATGGSQTYSGVVNDGRLPAAGRLPERLFSNTAATARSANGPVRANSSASSSRAQPYAFCPQASTNTPSFVNSPVNLTSRLPSERRSASHSAGAAVRLPV
eukprot:GHVU01060047.1.p1 GENE.GHVU01060047.1~~GHVU01060047.1.p1  ORF type:complete len:204 (-),score=14.65 GHVU01060047.1:740-1351(-)